MSAKKKAKTKVVTGTTSLPRGSNPKLASPLRYPGAKRRLLPLISDLVEANFGTVKPTFVEPFAGGASVGLGLLAEDRVSTVILGERDPMLAAFWRTATTDPEWLIKKVRTAEVSVKEWRRLRENPGSSDRQLAWACLYLNRTSYSGILHPQAGPIGGPNQTSEYKIDCRFPRPSLEARLERIAAWARKGRIRVAENDYRDTISSAASVKIAEERDAGQVVIYLDPPFFAKAQKLYRFAFTESDHTELAKNLKALTLPWILSYDHDETIVDLYAEHGRRHLVEMTYVASTARDATSELIITNLGHIPDDDRLEVLA